MKRIIQMVNKFIRACLVVSTCSLLGLLVSCNTILSDATNLKGNNTEENKSQEIQVGEKVVYGKQFSFNDLYTGIKEESNNVARRINARSASTIPLITEEDLVDMVYFSVQPSSVESLQNLNSIMGYLNPVELDKEIIQACDAEQLIFNNEAYEEIATDGVSGLDDFVKFENKYYYIETKAYFEQIQSSLEKPEVIEEFQKVKEESLNRIQEMILLEAEENGEDIFEDVENSSRGAWSNFWKSVGTGISQYFTYENPIKGKVNYQINNIPLPAYGVKVYLTSLGENVTQTKKDGSYDLGTKKDSIGLCTIWLDYENDACKVSNILNVAPRTLVRTDYPSKLKNLTIHYVDGYSNGKVAICSELLTRREREKNSLNKNYTLPKAIVWTLENGNEKTASAPCFNKLGAKDLPDIIFTGVKDFNLKSLKALHHEYSHYVHFNYTGNADNFWNNVVFSEICSTVAIGALDLVYKVLDILNDPIYYDFENQYVCFAENFAEWYSEEGYKKGCYGTKTNTSFGYYLLYDNVKVFNNLINEQIITADEIVRLIYDSKINTFAKFYEALINRKYKVNAVTKIFKDYYEPHGHIIVK